METYLAAKIKEALDATGDNRHDAQKLLITWAVRDIELLLSLCKPHLKAIVATQIEHAVQTNKTPAQNTPAANKNEASAPHAPPHECPNNAASENGFSTNDINALIASAQKTQKRPTQEKTPPPQSSARQAAMMQQLAEAYRKKD